MRNILPSKSIRMKMNFFDERERIRKKSPKAAEILTTKVLMNFLKNNATILALSKTNTLTLNKRFDRTRTASPVSDIIKVLTVEPKDVLAYGSIVEVNQKEAIFEFKLVDAKMEEELLDDTVSFDRMIAGNESNGDPLLVHATLVPTSQFKI